MDPEKTTHLTPVNRNVTTPKTRFFLEVAAKPADALEELRQTQPELVEEIADRQARAAAANRKANAGRFVLRQT